METFVAIDTETTGLDFENDRVIEFGATIFIRGRAVHRAGWYIQTDVPNNGEHVNGISPEQIAKGYPPQWSFLYIATLIHKAPRCIVAYNASFDLTMLAHEFRRHEVYYDYSRLRIVDPLVVYRRYHPFKPAKLTNACDKYRIPYDDAHTATADSEAAGHVWMALKRHHGIRYNYQTLESRQTEWNARWADNFTKWAASKGKEVTLNEWPYPKELECSPQNEQLELLSLASQEQFSSQHSSELRWRS